MSYSRIFVGQGQWAFTSSDSNMPIISTSSFGPCYAVTFSAGNKYAALAHIDDNIEVSSIQKIFDRFKAESIEPKDIKVVVMGGWKQNESSYLWGQQILKSISEAGVQHIGQSKFNTTETPQGPLGTYVHEVAKKYYIWGAQVDAQTGKTFVFNEENAGDTEVGYKRALSRLAMLSNDGDALTPLIEVFE